MPDIQSSSGVPIADLSRIGKIGVNTDPATSDVQARPRHADRGVEYAQPKGGDSPTSPKSSNLLPPGASNTPLDPALIISLVTELFNQLDEKQGANFVQQLQNAEPRQKEVLEKKLEELGKKFRKQLEVQKQQKNAQIVSDVQLGLGVALTIFGVLATILTAGALSGLMVAGMAIGAATTSLDVANRVIKALKVEYTDPLDKSGKTKKPLDISIGGLIKMEIEAEFAAGIATIPPWVDKNDPKAVDKYRDQLILGTTVVVTILLAAATIAMSAGGIMQAKKLAESGKEMAKAGQLLSKIAPKIADFASANMATIQMVNQSVDIAGDIVNLAASLYQGGNTITMANATLDMRMAENTANRLDAYADSERAIIELIQTAMKNSSTTIGDVKKLMSDIRAMLNAQLSETINAN